jgi:outer membrane protein assembly factor BamD
MPVVSVRKVARLLLLSAIVTAGVARAELVWSPETGWRIEGGALSGLSGSEANDALDRMNRARRYEEGEDWNWAARAYESVGRRYPNSVYAPEAIYRAAQCRLAANQYSRAFEDYQEVVTRYPNTFRFDEIIGEQYRIASALLDGARDRWMFGILPGFKAPEVAIEFYEILLINAPYSDYAPLALMNIARAHMRRGATLDAIDTLDRMVNNYRGSLLTPDAYLRLAEAHASLVQGANYDPTPARDAATYFYDFMVLYPADPGNVRATEGLHQMNSIIAEYKMTMADFYFLKRDNYAAARVLYNDAITAYPDSEIAEQSRARLAEVEAAAAGVAPPTAILELQNEEPRRRRFWLF